MAKNVLDFNFEHKRLIIFRFCHPKFSLGHGKPCVWLSTEVFEEDGRDCQAVKVKRLKSAESKPCGEPPAYRWIWTRFIGM